MTTVSLPQLPQTHCSGRQAISCSVLGRFAGSSCRPGWLRAVLSGNFNCSRSLSASTSAPLTPHHYITLSPVPATSSLLDHYRLPSVSNCNQHDLLNVPSPSLPTPPPV